MVCPRCGTEIPEGAQACPACGYETRPAGPAGDAPAPAPVPAPASTAGIERKKRWLYAALGAAAALLLVGLVALAVLVVVPYVSRSLLAAASAPSSVETSGQPGAATSASNDAAVKAGTKTVEDFYAAMNAGDLEKLKAAVVPDLRADIDAAMFEGWTATTFTFTRGWVEGTTAYVVGRESQQQFGAGDNGGVKFTLEQAEGKWLIFDFWSVDAAQVEGTDTGIAPTGIPGPLNETTAKELMAQVLAARKTGDGNAIRRLATETFLLDNGDDWLSGLDNAEYFTKYTIDSVTVTGTTASVVVTETWTDGEYVSTYGLVEQNGAVLLDTWEPQ